VSWPDPLQDDSCNGVNVVAHTQTERDAYLLREVAERVGPVSIRTVYNWIEHEGLKVTKIAGRPMVLKEDLASFVQKYRAA
jgi:transposase